MKLNEWSKDWAMIAVLVCDKVLQNPSKLHDLHFPWNKKFVVKAKILQSIEFLLSQCSLLN